MAEGDDYLAVIDAHRRNPRLDMALALTPTHKIIGADIVALCAHKGLAAVDDDLLTLKLIDGKAAVAAPIAAANDVDRLEGLRRCLAQMVGCTVHGGELYHGNSAELVGLCYDKLFSSADRVVVSGRE